ncbi:MAG: HK97 family phage prohead protease [Pseudomonadota bacterium]
MNVQDLSPEVHSSLLQQAASISTIDEKQRTVEVVFSSGEIVWHPVRHEGQFRLMPTRVVVTDEAGDFEFLQSGASVLEDHRPTVRSVVGSVVDAWITNGLAKAILRFTDAPDAEPTWHRIRDGSLKGISMGFRVHSQELRTEDGPDGPTQVLYFTSWEPLEISVVAVPADTGARIQSNLGQSIKELSMTTTSSTHLTAEPSKLPTIQSIGLSENLTQALSVAGVAPSKVAQYAEVLKAFEQSVLSHEWFAENASQLRQNLASRLAVSDEPISEILSQVRKQAIQHFASFGHRQTGGVGGPNGSVTESWDSPRSITQKYVDAFQSMLDRRHEPTMGRDLAGLRVSELVQGYYRDLGQRPSNTHEAVSWIGQSGSHSTSDFALVIGAAYSGAVARRMAETEVAIARASRVIDREDYKPGNAVDVTGAPMLGKVDEGGEIRHTTVDEEGEAIAIPEDYASILSISEKVIVNDQIGVLENLTPKLVTGANERLRQVLLAPLEANGGSGQTMRDGNPAFDASRGNLAAPGSALSVASLGMGRSSMRSQRDSQGSYLGAAPWALLVPPALETQAEQLLVQIAAAKASDANPFSGNLELLVEPGLTDETAWYVLADPTMIDGLQHSFLQGNTQPKIETRRGWNSLSFEMRIVWHIGAGFIQPRAWYRNAGE